MANAGKRIVSVTVRMSESDAQLFERAAARLWPEAVMSRSAMLLGVARIGAREVLRLARKRER
jgi:hypothetical protein